MLAPIFVVFVLTHVLLIGYGVFRHVPEIGAGGRRDPFRVPGRPGHARPGRHGCSCSCGPFPWAAAPTPASRPSPTACRSCASPGSRTARGPWSTWPYPWPSPPAASSSAISSSESRPVAGKTLNAVLAGQVFGGWSFGGALAVVTIFSEGALLLVAAQTGFVDGPRVMANMAVDYWFPHRFASLSDRLTMQNGVLLMGGAAILPPLLHRGPHLDARRHVLHQRLSDLLALPARHVPLLHPEPEEGTALEEAPAGPSHRPDRLPDHPDRHHAREVRPRRLADPAHHVGRGPALLPDQGPLQPGPQGRPRARRHAHGHHRPPRAITTPSRPTPRR